MRNNKYFKSLLLGLKNTMEYRADFALSIVSGVFAVIMQYFLWTAIYANTKSTLVYGYTYRQMIAYTIIAVVISKLVSTGFEWDIAEDIKNGGISKFLVQPINYGYYRISCFLGGKCFQLPFIFGVSLLFCIMTKINIELVRLVIFVPFILLAIMLNFLLFYCISTLAFWMSEVWGVFICYNLITSILSGGVFPLDIFGPKVMAIFNFLPFKYIVYYPINIINGKLSLNEISIGIIFLCVWIVIMSLIAKIIWKTGMKKYIAVGG